MSLPELAVDVAQDPQTRAVAVPDWGAAEATRTARAAGAARPLELRPVHAAGVGSGPLGGPAGPHAAAWASGYRDGRTEGYAEGHALGRADGAAAAEEAGRAAATAAVTAVADALSAELAAVNERLDALERDAVELGIALAEVVLEHQVLAARDPGLEALRRALAAARPRGPVVARLHPEDHALVDPDALPPTGSELQLVADPSVGRGGCVLDAGERRIDATIEGAVQRLRESLLGRSG